MGSAASKSRALPKNVSHAQPTIHRTTNVDQLSQIKVKLNKLQSIPDQQHQEAVAPSRVPEMNRNKTISDYINTKLGNIQIEKEITQLDPEHSSLKRLSNKKQLEDDYKKIIDNIGSAPKTGVIDTNLFKEILMSLGTVPEKEIVSRYNLSPELYHKIIKLSSVISVPTAKIQLPQQTRRRQRLSDDNEDAESQENTLNAAFSSILQGSQAGYDIKGGESDIREVKNERPAHSRLKNEVKRSFN